MDCSKSVCASCAKNCSGSLKSELAMRGCVANIYLKNGRKIAYACKLYVAQKASAPVLIKTTSTSKTLNNSFLNNPGLSNTGFMLPDIKVV